MLFGCCKNGKLPGMGASVTGAIAGSFPFISSPYVSDLGTSLTDLAEPLMSGPVSAVAEPSSRSVGPTTFAWSWRGTPIPVGYESLGPAGARPILMLPAMSTVSTRDELKALARQLETCLCIITDWPGFGDTARPRLDYDRDLSRCFLEALVAHLRSNLEIPAFPVIACGHGAGYAIDLEARRPGIFTHLVLIAPTWRGPLPTMMSGRKPVQDRIRRLIHAPVMGDLIYRLNVSRPVVRMMYRRHVFADPGFLSDDLLADRMRVTRRPGARFASACFVTGALDPFDDRAAFLAAAGRIGSPMLMLYGPDTPPKSRAEMEALADLAGIESRLLGRGALGMAEELAVDLAPLIDGFLSGTGPDS
jgi:pimeloyl-ACP methyl ester carboxylesterase